MLIPSTLKCVALLLPGVPGQKGNEGGQGLPPHRI